MKKQAVVILLLVFVSFLYSDAQEKANHQKAKNIILMIGDGMGLSQIQAAMVSSSEPLNIERFKHIGISKTYAASDFITDSGASGTALATGYKTYNGAIGVDMDTIPRPTILEYAEANGKYTGLVATSEITHATPASFISHQPSRNMMEEIALDFLKTDIEVFIGGGLKYFKNRKDGNNLTESLEANGYQVITRTNRLNKVTEGKVAGFLYKNKPPKKTKGRKEMLSISTEKAIELLDKGQKGFFLMIEGSQIDWAAHDKNQKDVIAEMLDFDKAIGQAMDFAKKDGNTLIIVTADHETGGMTITGGSLEENEVVTKFSTGGHTASMVPVFAFGPGSELFQGLYENTQIFHKMLQAYGIEPILTK